MSTPTMLKTETAIDSGTNTATDVAAELRRGVTGAVHVPGDAAYDEQLPTYRGAPAVVVEASGPADVQAAVLIARAADAPLTVQSTGHGTLVPPDGGVLLKTSGMAQVLVDPDRQVAHVGPGARWSEVIAAAEPFGLAPLSGDTPSVGVVGYTLGGGLSWLSRKYGFAADSLLKVDLVTADGRLITVDQRRNAELFWAIRGGSGNFGVVTALEFRLYPAAQVYGGAATFPVERAAAVLKHFARNAEELPHELSLSFVVSPTTITVRGVYAGSELDARRALQPLWQVAGEPLADSFRTMNYADTRTIGGTPPRQFEMFDALPDAFVDEIVATVTRPGTEVNALEIKHWGGAIADPQHPNPGPVSHRDVPFVMKMDAPADAVAGLIAQATGGSFLNFLHDTTLTRTAYTPENYRRLQTVKQSYDPQNFFHRNHNIAPAAMEAAG